VVREGWGQGGEMTQALYAHINNKIIKKTTDSSEKFPLVKMYQTNTETGDACGSTDLLMKFL
jgi:hypothetical protein